MYIRPSIVTLSKKEIQNLVAAKSSCSSGSAYCSSGATYCGSNASYNGNKCASSVIYCSGGNYTGTLSEGSRI